MDCDKKCYHVGITLHNTEMLLDKDPDMEIDESEIEGYDAFVAVVSGDFGHTNYALAAYCVTIGHVNCLKQLHTDAILQWHDDLADVAIECDNLECLTYVVAEMGDVTIHPSPIGPNCKEFVQRMITASY